MVSSAATSLQPSVIVTTDTDDLRLLTTSHDVAVLSTNR